MERSDEEIRLALDDKGLIYTREKNISAKIATLLSEGKVVARYEGRSEFGPRALGHRSIMASPLHQEMKDVINSRIKHRERFRPFAPACLAEDIKDYFYAEDDAEFMLIIPQVKPDKQDIIPAVVHNDGTARVQAVHKSKNPGFYDIIEEFKKITGVPVVINTSFNVNGETIVESPQDAIECFLYTDIDYLAIGDYLVSKTDNLSARIKLSRSAFLELRKQRYCQQSWCRQLFWSSDTGSVSASESDLDAQERRMKWRRMASVLHRHLVAMPYPAFCIVGAGEIGIVFLNALRNRMQISCLVDKQAESMQGFSVPVKTLEQAIAEGERHFIIASEAFESELKARIKKLLPTEQIVMFGISDIITMMTSSVK
ncbi:carbamoyltransferase C-terminal domain-containing protein [Aeromonas veronii]|uniref:carbamoyltransferase C-terminal domain-containing protein n=1 Tax=Aeromonas veronii TaxID=654 RepID=UPI0013E01EFA|nr:carbamoyltransferase C-terminal domain-containing protein [Aeromonas veronii]